MGQKRKHFMPGTIFHVCNRAAMRAQIFADTDDYVICEKTLAESLEKYGIILYAYCIMPNHWHLLVQEDTVGSLSRCLQRYASTQARRYRRRHNTEGLGAVYQNRFHANPVQLNESFLRVAQYIERNPVKAGLCFEAKSWRWSSAFPNNNRSIPLDPWPMIKPVDWEEILKEPTRGDWTERIEISLVSQIPLGQMDWQKKISPL
jgi:putative transposase